MSESLFRYALLALMLGVYVVSGRQLENTPRPSRVQEMQVALPLFAQVGMTGGDRFLAANIAGFRALLVESDKLPKEDFHVLGQVQRDVAWLNPAHEDNYYIGTAILPWNGELDAAQYILKRAIYARPFDWQPIFYYAFHLYHFKRDPVGAANWLRKAAPRAQNENDRMVLENLAARWYEKGYNPKVAAGVVEDMATHAREGAFKKYLVLRASRLRTLILLQDAAEKYQEQTGRPLNDLQDLVRAGFFKTLPEDPFGFGYELNSVGKPILRNAPAGQQR